MMRPRLIIKPWSEKTRLLLTCGDEEVMRTALPPPRGIHPRAAETLLTGLALWLGRQVIEQAEHRVALLAERHRAVALKGRDRLRAVAPDFAVLLDRWSFSGPSLGLHVTRAIKLLDLYGDAIFALAVTEIVSRGLRDTSALAVACDRVRREQRRPLPIDIPLGTHLGDRDVVPHDLGVYDAPK